MRLIVYLLFIIFFESCYHQYEVRTFKNVTTSSSDSSQPANLAYDKDTTTFWNSGAKNLQWIKFDFNKTQNIGKINIIVYSIPSSNVNIKVYAKTENISNYTQIMYKFLSVKDRDKITLETYVPKATSILITEDNKESNVGFREVEFINSF